MSLILRLVVRVTAVAIVITATAAAAPSLVTIDERHPLAGTDAIETFETEGVVAANLTQIDLGMTVAESSAEAGIDGFHVDIGRTFLCLDYREGLDRQLRLYLPEAYFEPRPATLSALDTGPSATFEPVSNGSMTAVTLTVTEPTRACYALSSVSGGFFGAKGWASDLVGNVTGFELPSLGGPPAAEWGYIDGAALAGNDTVRLPVNASDPVVQYDSDPTAAGESWINVPDCSDPADQAVCQFDRHNHTLLMSTHPDPPTVRYRAGGGGVVTDVSSAWNSFTAALDGMTDWLGSLFGGG